MKYRATSYTHGIPKDAGRPIKSVVFEADDYSSARREAHKRLPGAAVIGIKVER